MPVSRDPDFCSRFVLQISQNQNLWIPAQAHTGMTGRVLDPGSGLYREDADETLDPGSTPYREDEEGRMIPGSKEYRVKCPKTWAQI